MNSPGKLLSLEYARGSAAIIVLLFHIGYSLEIYFHDSTFFHIFSFGHIGVDFFFVLSGFIILYTNHHYLNHSYWIASYFKKRLIRIYPVYWSIFLMMTLWHLMQGHIGEGKEYPWVNMIKCFFLFPLDEIPGTTIVGSAWTLPFEMLFYVAFMLFFINKLTGASSFAIWALLIISNDLSDHFLSKNLIAMTNVKFLWIFFSPYILQFILGMISAYLFLHYSKRTLCLIIGITGGISTASILFAATHSNIYLNGLFFFSVLSGLATWEKYRGIATSEFFLLLGRASYTIYLTHMASIQLCMRPLTYLNPHMNLILVFMIVLFLASIIGLLYHLYVELPLQKYLRTLDSKQVLREQMTSG